MPNNITQEINNKKKIKVRIHKFYIVTLIILFLELVLQLISSSSLSQLPVGKAGLGRGFLLPISFGVKPLGNGRSNKDFLEGGFRGAWDSSFDSSSCIVLFSFSPEGDAPISLIVLGGEKFGPRVSALVRDSRSFFGIFLL